MDKKYIYNLNKESIELYKSCFDKNGSPKNIDNIKWQLVDNSVSKSFVNILFDKNKELVCGIHAAACVNFKIQNDVFLGAQTLDIITDINYRGQGVFTNLTNDAYKRIKESEVALVYGFPNGNSVYGFEKKLNWKIIDPIPFLIKPLKTKYFTDKIPFLKFLPNINLYINKNKTKINPNYTIFKENKFPSEVNNLWKSFSKNINVSVIRDKKYLNWRYLKKPNEKYSIAHCYDSTKNYLGFIVYTNKEKHGGNIGYIMELIYDLKHPYVAKLLLEYATTELKNNDADCILAWCFGHSPNFKIFSKNMFLKFPKKLRPIELHFGFRVFKKKHNSIISNRENWYISYSDSDTV